MKYIMKINILVINNGFVSMKLFLNYDHFISESVTYEENTVVKHSIPKDFTNIVQDTAKASDIKKHFDLSS